MTIKNVVWDTENPLGEPKAKPPGAIVTGGSFIIPLLTDSKSTTFGKSSPIECGNMIWDPEEFDVYETVWRALTTETGNGYGVLQLWNYNTLSEIARFSIEPYEVYDEKETVITLPSTGGAILIGGRLWRQSGSGTVICHVSNVRIREN